MQIVCTKRPLIFALWRRSTRRCLAVDVWLCAYISRLPESIGIDAGYDCSRQEEYAIHISRAFEDNQEHTDHSATPRPVVALARLHVEVVPNAKVEQDASLMLNFFSMTPFCIPFAVQAHVEANTEIQKIVNIESSAKKTYGLARRHNLVQQGTMHYELSGVL